MQALPTLPYLTLPKVPTYLQHVHVRALHGVDYLNDVGEGWGVDRSSRYVTCVYIHTCVRDEDDDDDDARKAGQGGATWM